MGMVWFYRLRLVAFVVFCAMSAWGILVASGWDLSRIVTVLIMLLTYAMMGHWEGVRVGKRQAGKDAQRGAAIFAKRVWLGDYRARLAAALVENRSLRREIAALKGTKSS